MPAASGHQRFSLAKFWHHAFRRTYSAELRNEKPETIRAIYESAPDRYDAAARYAFEELEERGAMAVLLRGGSVDMKMSFWRRAAARFLEIQPHPVRIGIWHPGPPVMRWIFRTPS